MSRQTTSIDREVVLNLTMMVSNILHLDLAHHESVDLTRQVALTILSTTFDERSDNGGNVCRTRR